MKNLFNSSNGQNITDERIGTLLGGALGPLPENSACPLPETIAALSENKIGGEERERLLLHLAGCDRCRAAYSMLCEMIPRELPAANTDFRWQARRLVPLAAAAGLILVIVSWPFLTHREGGVNEAVSPYIQRPAAIEPEKPATSTATPAPGTGETPQDVHVDIKVVTPKPEPQIPAEKEMATAPLPIGQAAPSPSIQAVSPEAQMPARESVSAGVAPRTMAPPEMAAQPMGGAPSHAAKAAAKPSTTTSGAGYPGLSRQAAEAPKQADEFEPHFIAAPITKSAENQAEPLNLSRRVEIDEGQRLRLSRADAATSDKLKIAGIFNDLKLDACGFPLQDINKVVVQWTGSPRRRDLLGVDEGAKAAGAQPGEREKVQANISLEDGGVLTINVQGTPLLRKNRGAKIPVGC